MQTSSPPRSSIYFRLAFYGALIVLVGASLVLQVAAVWIVATAVTALVLLFEFVLEPWLRGRADGTRQRRGESFFTVACGDEGVFAARTSGVQERVRWEEIIIVAIRRDEAPSRGGW